ncbi:hypothetical protein BH23GEM6_BH23GEM6_14640 [soil metagenome]
MKRTYLQALALPLVFLLAACPGDDRRVDTVGTVDTPMAAPGMGTGTAAPGTGTMAGMTSTVAMRAVGGSGLSGEATLTEAGQQAQVMVRLMGSRAGATHQGHIHQGTCDNLGSVVAPLQPVTVDAQGTGTSTSTVDVAIHAAADGQHLIAYHVAGGDPGAPVVCGEIPAHMM